MRGDQPLAIPVPSVCISIFILSLSFVLMQSVNASIFGVIDGDGIYEYGFVHKWFFDALLRD